jgi:hypothetical protein
MKKLAIAMALVMMVVFAAGFTAMAQQMPTVKKISGVVDQIDTQAGTITIKAEAKMLEGIKVGDKVKIMKAETMEKLQTPAMPSTPSMPSAPSMPSVPKMP